MPDETTPTPTIPEPKGDTVPLSRFSQVVSERNEARELSAGYKARLTELGGEHTSALGALQARLDAGTTALASRERELYLSRQHGIHDPELVEYLGFKHSHAPKGDDGKPPAFEAWLTAYKATEPAVLRNGAGKPPALNAGTQELEAKEPAVDVAALTTEQYRAKRKELLAANKLRMGRPV